ncbi:MAG: caspase family protein [Polyangiales bacterium]
MKHRAILSALTLTTLLGTTSVVHAQRRSPGATANARVGGAQRFRLDGSLSERDRTDEQGHHLRSRRIALHRGDRVTFTLSSSEFDTIARVAGPGGGTWQDDDGAGEGTNSLLRFVAPQDGTYTFVATSYAQGETGAFQALIDIRPGSAPADEGWDNDGDDNATDDDDRDDADDRADAPAPTPPAAATNGAGRTFGIFVGITNYQGENNNLPGSAADAVHLARAFQQAGWMQRSNAVVLTDREATLANVQQAFRTVAPRVGANDTFVFFYDGHGSSSALDLRGADLSRDALGRMMGNVRGRQLLVLDSCSAGGFAPLVRGQRNRAGLFSSSATETSSTAPAVGAGGWLAYAFREAVNGGVQRRDDGSLDFNEVVSYVREQYQSHDVDQTLVAVNSRGGSFAIGGQGDAVADVPADTAVAANDEPERPGFGGNQLPALIPLIPEVLNGMRLPAMRPGAGNAGDSGLFGSNDQFASMLSTGMQIAGQVLEAATK